MKVEERNEITLDGNLDMTQATIELLYLQNAYRNVHSQLNSVMVSLKKDPFNSKLIEGRNNMQETLRELQEILTDLSRRVNNNFRKAYNVELKWMPK